MSIATAAASTLLPILVTAGTNVLAGIVEKHSPVAAVVIRELANELGVSPTPEAIGNAYRDNPGTVIAAAREVEASDPAMWEYLAAAGANQAALLKREDARESWFSWAWRPTMSWLLIAMWTWSGIIQGVINVAFGLSLVGLSVPDLLAFSGIWLTIYGGGHTLKDIAAKYVETKTAAGAK